MLQKLLYLQVDVKDPVFTVYDSTSHKVRIPLGHVRRKLATLLDMYQLMTGTHIINWNTVLIQREEVVPKQADGDGVNCSIFVWLMLELLMEVIVVILTSKTLIC